MLQHIGRKALLRHPLMLKKRHVCQRRLSAAISCQRRVPDLMLGLIARERKLAVVILFGRYAGFLDRMRRDPVTWRWIGQ